MRNELKTRFDENYTKFHSMTLQQRPYSTRVGKKPPDLTVNIVESLAREHLSTISEPSYWDVNVSMYAATVTIKYHMNDLKEVNVKHETERQMPKWISQTEEKVGSLRKRIGHLDTVIKCRIENNFTPHQQKYKDIFLFNKNIR